MVVGVALGKKLPDFTAALSKLEFGSGSQVNIPIAVLIWLMIFPMMLLIFAFQAENLTTRWFAVVLIAVPILIQVYFNSSLTYLLMHRFKVPHNVASPGALIGASNFFEVGRGGGHHAIWPKLRCGIGVCCRSAGGSAGDVVGL